MRPPIFALSAAITFVFLCPFSDAKPTFQQLRSLASSSNKKSDSQEKTSKTNNQSSQEVDEAQDRQGRQEDLEDLEEYSEFIEDQIDDEEEKSSIRRTLDLFDTSSKSGDGEGDGIFGIIKAILTSIQGLVRGLSAAIEGKRRALETFGPAITAIIEAKMAAIGALTQQLSG